MELRCVTAAPSESCADTKGPLQWPPRPRSPEKTDADGSLLTRAVRTSGLAGCPSAAPACECLPRSRKTAHCCGCAQAPWHHPHLRGIDEFVITAHCAFAGASAAIDAACSLLTRSVNAANLNGRAMAAWGRMISIGRAVGGGTAPDQAPAAAESGAGWSEADSLAAVRRHAESAVAHGLPWRLRGKLPPGPQEGWNCRHRPAAMTVSANNRSDASKCVLAQRHLEHAASSRRRDLRPG